MSMITRRGLLLTASASTLAAGLPRLAQSASGAPIDGPPVARVESVTETFFGQSVSDPYRWMENAQDRDWEPFVRGQADYTRRLLDKLPGRKALAERIGELSADLEQINAVMAAGPYIFTEKRPVGANAYQLFLRDHSGTERLLLDPESRTAGEIHSAVNYWAASPDGRYLLYGISAAGSEDSVIEIMETATGRILPERIDRAQYAHPNWLEDGSGFFFNRLAEGAQRGGPDAYKNSVCWFHALNTDPASDVRVLSRGQFADVSVGELDFPNVFCQPGSPYALGLLLTGVQNERTLYVNSLDAARRGSGAWRKLCGPEDKVVGYALQGDDIYLLTHLNAPRYRVLNVKASSPSLATAQEIVSQGDAVILNVAAAKDGLYVHSLDGGVSRLDKVEGGTAHPIALPFDGAISAAFASPLHEGLWFALESWVRPARLLHVDQTGKVEDTGLVRQPAIDVSPYESTRIFAAAKDGARVPVSVVYRRGVRRDGSAPAIVDAYGAYGAPLRPVFGPRFIAWLERGGVWATAHVRGGGEYGQDWYEGGKLAAKPNTWRDLIASCEALIAEGWTGAKTLAIRGASAGAIAVGRAMTERPDLFATVICTVGGFNPLRLEHSRNGAPNVTEFGSVNTESGFKILLEMDPYQHVTDGTAYPAAFFTTGMNDPRVEPWQVAKMTARLQAASSSGKPVIMRVEFQAGHGMGTTRSQRDAEVADSLAFALWQSGAPGFVPKS